MDDLGDVRLEQLTAEMAWIRRIARALVNDASTADDIAQETWLAAAGRIPDDRPLRPWLSRVVTNVVRMRFRGESRRSVREEAAEKPADVATAEELIDRVEVQRVVAGEVLALAEPYRSTVLLHYFEGLPSAEIARRQGIPDGTVRRRLKTALDELRRRLGSRDDRRGGWLPALAPLAAWAPRPSPALTVWGIAMKKVVVGFVLLVLLVLGIVWFQRGRGEHHESTVASTTAATKAGGRQATTPTGATAEMPWLVQRGAPERKIAGHVVYQGAPVAGATVRLASVIADLPARPGGAPPTRELATVQTGADGSFDFGARVAANWMVSAEAENRTPASVWLLTNDPAQKPDQIVIELGNCRSRLLGTVVDSSGGGVAKARLSVAGTGGTDASEKGEYALCVPTGEFQVRVVADGYGAIEQPIHLVGELRHDFELVPESVIAGRVVDDANRPIANARVIALPAASEQPHFTGSGSALADADGRFRLENLAPGTFQLSAVADGFGTDTPTRAVATPGTGHEITLVVARRARISGRVMSAGSPVAGAVVHVEPPVLLASRAVSQPDGSFTLDGVPFGKTKLAAKPYAATSPIINVDRAELDKLVIEVTELASLEGTITRHGKPVANAEVQYSLGAGGKSDAQGKYVLRGLPAGPGFVMAQEMTNVFAFSPNKPVTIEAGKANHADIELTGGAYARGVVVDETGKPVPHVYVRMIEPKGDLGESMTDAEGKFECTTMLGGGDYRVSVYPSPAAQFAFKPAKGEQDVVTIKDGDTEVNGLVIAIKYEPMTIAGKIVDDTGAPVADVHIEAIGTAQGGGGAGGMLPAVRADGSGQFVVRNLARGIYNLHAHAADGSEAEVLGIAAGARDVVVKLIRPGTIEGTLVGFSTSPTVQARTLTPDLSMGNDGIVDGNHFVITGLVPGKYTVEATAGDEKGGASVVVRSGVTEHVKLESRGRGMVAAHVTEFGTGKPIAGMGCLAALSLGGQAGVATNPPSNLTDAKGAVTLGAPIGKVRVMCLSSDGSYSAAGGDVDVAAGTPASIELFAVKPVPPPCDPGFRITPLTLPLVIAQVDPQGPAKTSGLQAGDKVVSIDGASTAGLLPAGAMTLARNHRPGTTLALGVERAGQPLTIKIVVAKESN